MAEQLTFEQHEAQAARLRAELGATRAADKAQRLDPSWTDTALEAVRAHARDHEVFMAEDVVKHCPMPQSADPRAWGSVLQSARRRGWIKPDGYAPANSSNRSPKVRWRSLICAKEAS